MGPIVCRAEYCYCFATNSCFSVSTVGSRVGSSLVVVRLEVSAGCALTEVVISMLVVCDSADCTLDVMLGCWVGGTGSVSTADGDACR